uniref:PDZ domain-containing protein n=1 Tax=Leersia perrieri TaxID=77586 RepID=A0A0D9WD42_9ORYZ
MPPKSRSSSEKKNPSPGQGRGGASASTERRVTRLRSRELGVEPEATGAGDDPALPTRKKRNVQPRAAAPPPARLPRVIPPYPNSGKSSDVLHWAMEFQRISDLPCTIIPCTCRTEPIDHRTAIDVASTPDKNLIKKAARSVVGVVSTKADGKHIASCSGIVVSWNDTTRLATIITSSATVCLCTCQTRPLLRDNCFFNAYYRIALLEVLADSPLQPATFGSSPKFGQEVFALARDEESSLFARRGTVLLHERPKYLDYIYCQSLSCQIARGGTGGPVIDGDGDFVGMAFGRSPNADILPISIMDKCFDMWTRFSRIARPVFCMDLRAFELLDVSQQEEIELVHNIYNGFIVSVVYDDSVAARPCISPGDVIVSYNRQRDFTPHKFEEYLLSFDLDLLARADSSWTVGLEGMEGGRPKSSLGDGALTALSSWDSMPLRPVSIAFNATDGCVAEGTQ